MLYMYSLLALAKKKQQQTNVNLVNFLQLKKNNNDRKDSSLQNLEIHLTFRFLVSFATSLDSHSFIDSC
jgi:hypothetical protein